MDSQFNVTPEVNDRPTTILPLSGESQSNLADAFELPYDVDFHTVAPPSSMPTPAPQAANVKSIPSPSRTPLLDIFSQTAPTAGSPSSVANLTRTASIAETPTGNAASSSNRTAPAPAPDNANSSQSTIRLPERKCGCQCLPTCSCFCPCRDHCICPPRDHSCNETCHKKKCEYKCWGKCGSRKNYRNLVVCLDGTSNQFGHFNTNVVELHSRVLKDDGSIRQLTFYSSGIGTHVPSGKHSLGNWLYNAVDMAIAWNFRNIVEKAYRWLADNYKPRDRIYLFGFSRGAYQVRALAGMVERLGLVFAGNTALTPLAYELYRNKHRGRKIRDKTEAEAFAANFKRTFSRKVKVHFIGAWDTVSSVGFIRQRPLPLTASASHVCFFRQGLALDERRVKFLPEFLTDGRVASSHSENPELNIITNVKEVWFVGSHSDIGGSNERKRSFDLTSVPLSWMEHEASEAGLRFAEREAIGEWTWDHLRKDKPTRSLRGPWWIPEYLPIKWSLYSGKEISTTRARHRGRGRSILPQQCIHASVMFQHRGYTPLATFLGDKGRDWASLLEINEIAELEDLSWADEWAYMLDMDLFDDSIVRMTIGQLKGDTFLDPVLILQRLAFMALSDRCAKKIAEVIGELVAMLANDKPPDIQAASASCLFQLAKHSYGEQIIEEGAGVPLQNMLHRDGTRETRVASLQCLSQLILEPSAEQTGCLALSTPSYVVKARDILVNQPEAWSDIVFDLIDKPQRQSQKIVGLSCLARLATIEQTRGVLVTLIRSTSWSNGLLVANREKLKNYRSIFPEPRNRDEKHGFAATLLELLGQPETGFHAISLLQFMSAELHGVITSSDVYYKERLLDQLMSMIQDGHPKAKGTAVLCLSNYFKADSKFRRSTFHLEPDLIVILTNKLFGINSHCFPAQIEAVKTAFLAIVTHDDSVDELADLKVINAIVRILCIEGWFDLEGGSGLLYRILSRDVNDGDITGVMVSVANIIIRELVLGSVSGDATCLHQTQAFFVRLCNYEKLYTLMTANQDIIDTIIDAMNQPRRRAKAVTFLERIAKDGYARQLMLNISLLDKIAKLGKNIIRKKSPLSVLGPAFTAVGKKTVVGDRGTLSAVRAALEVFASHEIFTQSLLDESVFQVITDGITTDVLKFREGHRVKAQIAGVRCLRELVKFEDARQVILSGEITNELIELLRAYNDEPDSSQWLRGWSDYGDLLEDTLKQLMKHEDAQEIVSNPRNLSLIRLMQFSPPRSNIHSWSERPRRLSTEQDSDRWSFSEGSIRAI